MMLEELFGVKGKTALVTGGGTGIGLMIATALVAGGAKVFICSRKEAVVKGAAEQIASLGHPGSVEAFVGDVGSKEGVDDLVAQLRSRTDTLDILVNNAGITWGAPLTEFPFDAWQKVLDVNVSGLMYLTQSLFGELAASGKPEDPARVINIGSLMGTAPMGDGAYSYAASKAAVHHMTRILAKELAARHITVNAFAPGPFQSKMTAFATGSDELAQKVGQNVPLGRIGQASDIQGATLFLCGKAGAYTTGAILPLDGGLHVETASNIFAH
ncbi:SDR family oxidoreductase [Shimia thalassica]|uniref:SDR family oxidoreductase n=1 Tax=Shimia thalassica TaxID=1715693 RepID=UPI0026E3B783|nr:SDR family oxidoreductase [Shimia thalassica]MDO6522644.1 SDR family oxidoreductase [Shimia thalassica]